MPPDGATKRFRTAPDGDGFGDEKDRPVLKFAEEIHPQTEREITRIRQAMLRVRHPLYLHLITSLVDSMTLHIAAVEGAIGRDDPEGAQPSEHFDG
jgi:hypothetical protein